MIILRIEVYCPESKFRIYKIIWEGADHPIRRYREKYRLPTYFLEKIHYDMMKQKN